MKEPLKLSLGAQDKDGKPTSLLIVDSEGTEVCKVGPVSYEGLDSAQVHFLEDTIIGGLVRMGHPVAIAKANKELKEALAAVGSDSGKEKS